jgi:hypothetical protein
VLHVGLIPCFQPCPKKIRSIPHSEVSKTRTLFDEDKITQS